MIFLIGFPRFRSRKEAGQCSCNATVVTPPILSARIRAPSLTRDRPSNLFQAGYVLGNDDGPMYRDFGPRATNSLACRLSNVCIPAPASNGKPSPYCKTLPPYCKEM